MRPAQSWAGHGWSRARLGAIDRHGDRASAADIDAVDPHALAVAHAERLGALREGAVLMRLDERETAAAGFQKLGRAGAGRVPQLGPGQKHEARLVIAGGGDLRIVAA